MLPVNLDAELEITKNTNMNLEQRLQLQLDSILKESEPATQPRPKSPPNLWTGEQVARYLHRRQHDWHRNDLLLSQYRLTTVNPMHLDVPGDSGYSNPLDGERDVDQDYIEYLINHGGSSDPIVLDGNNRIIDGVHRTAAAQNLHHTSIPALVPVGELDEMTFKLCESRDAVRVVQQRLRRLDRRDHDTVDRIIQQVAKDRGLDATRLHALWAEADGIANRAWRDKY